MDEKYFPEKIEPKWQKKWRDSNVFAVQIDDEREKFYCLEMLPYPSGFLHMGHVRNYSIGDALSWYKRLKGFNVLHPIGWDSFGQPAEQAAVKRGVNPRDWTEQNIIQMREQFQKLGLSYDWSREIAAHRPEYYKFDQWFFLKLYEKGLAYKKDSLVNWCPYCKTTLSNEQASGGTCWRCNNQVEKQARPQWFFKITHYAEQLLDDMREIETGWAEKVLTMQRNWIGKSEGAFVEFKVQSPKSKVQSQESIRVFTTRIDTIYGVNAIVVAAEHPIIENHFHEFDENVRTKIEQIRVDKMKVADNETEPEKDGVTTTLTAINPFSGEKIPVWVANYVLIEYGTGAVMSVPAHDERDFEFANKYDLPIQIVIESKENPKPENNLSEAYSDYGVLINSDSWNGKASETAKREMAQFAESKGFGESAITYRLRDWGVSRQRFWGAPIPMIYCERCGIVPEKYENLPVELPQNAEFTGTGESPLAKDEKFVNTVCPNCGEPAKRETDTMDTFVDSCWYFYRYLDPHNTEMPFDEQIAKFWMPIDQYIGGVEHAVLHLLYARFWTKAMRDMGLVTFNEPIKRLLTQGMVVGETFYDDSSGKNIYYPRENVEIERGAKGKIIAAKLEADGTPLKFSIEKMSKSTGNGVTPDEIIEIYGSDSARLFELFSAPVENELVWNDAGIEGASRFLSRVHRFAWKWREHLRDVETDEPQEISAEARKLRQKTHQTINRVESDFERLQLNTPIAALMEMTNALYDCKIEPETATSSDLFAINEAVRSLTLMLAPYAPHAAEEIWSHLTNNDEGILRSNARFPVYQQELAKKDEIEIPIQINGKLRSRLLVAPETASDELEKLALADEKAREFTDGKQIVKVVVVPKRLVNIVIK
ncbi:MAG: leucine--tRNA ligase [Pyrinomonadaceae bacterium]|nr:leucine--tRNA ligase [Pyrinomonadaceae bacterium]